MRTLVLLADFPDKEHHGWKFIRFGPDGQTIYYGARWAGNPVSVSVRSICGANHESSTATRP